MIAEMQRTSWAIMVETTVAMLNPCYDLVESMNAQVGAHRPNRPVVSRGPTPSVARRDGGSGSPMASHALEMESLSAATAEQPTRNARLAAVWSRIQSYAALEPSWAGPNTEAPNAATISRARKVLAALPHTADSPLVAASGDGEIVFTWLVGRDRIEASLDDEGYLSWACRVSGVVSAGGSIEIDREPLAPFTDMLASHYA